VDLFGARLFEYLGTFFERGMGGGYIIYEPNNFSRKRKFWMSESKGIIQSRKTGSSVFLFTLRRSVFGAFEERCMFSNFLRGVKNLCQKDSEKSALIVATITKSAGMKWDGCDDMRERYRGAFQRFV
jgi:hypothetical protein